MRNIFRAAFAFTISLLILCVGTASAELVIDHNYQLVSSTRVGRTAYDYTYQVNITNNGSDVQNVTAAVSSGSLNTTIIDGNVNFGDVAGGGTIVTSTDTFSFRQNRKYAFDSSSLSWEIQFTDSPPKYTKGTDHEVVTKNIGVDGGRIEVSGTGTVLDGVSIEFPPGALRQEISLKVGYNDGSLSIDGGGFSGVVIDLNVPEDSTHFYQPVVLTVPLHSGDDYPIPVYIDNDGNLYPMKIIEVNRSAGTFSFITYHASWFSWIIPTAYAPAPDEHFITDFNPSEDGFQIKNSSSEYTKGNCYGMSAFTQWYFSNHKSNKGDFYPKYYDELGRDSNNKAIRGQDIIAIRAHVSTLLQNVEALSDNRNDTSSDKDRFFSIINQLYILKKPVLLNMWDSGGPDKGYHTVLAYGYNSLAGTIFIYDPNAPGTQRIIEYDVSEESFKDYRWNQYLPWLDANDFMLTGHGSVDQNLLANNFQSILDDAENNFQGTNSATITINSYTNGAEVNDRTITLSGTIESGGALINNLVITIENQIFETRVGVDGIFSKNVVLNNGINHIKFQTWGDNNLDMCIMVSNNMERQDFTLNLVDLAPTAPELLAPENDSILDPAQATNFTWTPSTDLQGDPISYCIVINDRGNDLDGTVDDTLAYNTCEPNRPEYEESWSQTEYPIPEDTLPYDHNYTWAVFAKDDQNNWSQVSQWWNFSTSSEYSPSPNPQIVGWVDTPGYACAVDVSSSYAYVADDNEGLQVIDISDPSNPVLVASVDIRGWTEDVYLSDSYAYVAINGGIYNPGGLYVVDVSDPQHPTIAGSVNMPGDAYGICVAGSYAYVAAGTSGIHVVDISNPINPTIIGSVNIPLGPGGAALSATSVYVSGSYAYVTDYGYAYTGGFEVIDISSPNNPTIVGSADIPIYGAHGLYVSGSYAYVGGDNGCLNVVDINDPQNPTIIGSANVCQGCGSLLSIYVSNSYAYVCPNSSTLYVVDINNGESPTVAASVDMPYLVWDVHVVGSYAYVATSFYGLQVISIFN